MFGSSNYMLVLFWIFTFIRDALKVQIIVTYLFTLGSVDGYPSLCDLLVLPLLCLNCHPLPLLDTAGSTGSSRPQVHLWEFRVLLLVVYHFTLLLLLTVMPFFTSFVLMIGIASSSPTVLWVNEWQLLLEHRWLLVQGVTVETIIVNLLFFRW